jgi:endoglucanase
VADWNSASAASLDIILALILGSRKWEDATLKTRALAIAADVLEQETAETELGLAPLPGAWSRNEEGDFVINPSYASPATFRMLYTLSRDKRWLRLVASSYEIWERTGKRVGRARGVGLPPDWCRLTKQGRFEHATGRSTAYGWDALRTPLRAGLDALLMKKKTARQYLAESQVRFFRKRLSKASPPRPAAVYAYWGAVADPTESLAMTASALFAFQAAGAKELKVLAQSFDKQRKQDMFARNYYAQSLAFYPLAFRAGIFDAVRKK